MNKSSAQGQMAIPGTAAALVYCRDLVANRRSPLVLMAATLPPPRQALFYPAYAAMRIIDDFVDDDFLARSKARRQEDRAEAKQRVARWRYQAETASLGADPDHPAHHHQLIFHALQTTLGQGTLGPGPWRALAKAMLHDLSEETLVTWSDFDNYAEGAAVAPAAIFIYILTCKFGPNGSSQISGNLLPQDLARDLAKYCYLVHILRDIRTDAAHAPQLLTIPRQVLEDCRLHKNDIATATDLKIRPLAELLCAHAARHRALAEEVIAPLLPNLGQIESGALQGLIRLYDEQHAKNCDLYDLAT